MKRGIAWLLITVLLLSTGLVGCETAGGWLPSATDENVTQGVPDADDAHVDQNDDGTCDDCGTSVVIELDLFAINDLHGKLCDSDTQAGVDELTTYLKQAYLTEEHVLVLSAGDMWQGSSESNLTRGAMVTEWMNEVDVVSMTLGNHEYDWGEAAIQENAALAEFPFLAINVYSRATNRRVDYCQPSVLVKRGGAKIGVIGAIGDCYSSISGDYSDGVYFKVGRELTALVREEARRLREAGADFIVYALHDGYERSSAGTQTVTNSRLSGYYDAVLSDGSVDLVFEGHTHQSYVLQDSAGVYHLQGGGDNKGISYAEAVINFANGRHTVREARTVKSSEYASLADDAIVDALLKKYEEQVSLGTRVLGKNDFDRNANELCLLMADLYLQEGLRVFGTEYPIVLAGGYMSVRSPGYLAAGDVTFAQVQGIFPFENELVLCSIKGSDLLSRFINTTNDRYFIQFSTYGSSIKEQIDPQATYYLVTDTYSSTYAPNRLTEIKRHTGGVYAQHLLAAYIEAGGLTSNLIPTYTSIAEALQIGAALSDNERTPVGYYVQGTVVEIENTTWGNLYIADDSGNRLFVYGLYDETGKIRYDALPNPPAIGDSVLLYAPILRYVNTQTGVVKIELQNARICKKV